MDKIYYAVYKITNEIDGKFYIGSHKTKNLDDKYMGSGKYLKRAQEKYGLESFKREILFIFDTPEEMYDMEAHIVNEDFLVTENTYNLKVGGFGGWDYINANMSAEIRHMISSNGAKSANMNGGIFKGKEHSLETIRILREKNLGELNPMYGIGSFSGKSHTSETKERIGSANSVRQSGSGNSQYNTMWIYNLELKISKKINKDDIIPDGWNKGRKLKF